MGIGLAVSSDIQPINATARGISEFFTFSVFQFFSFSVFFLLQTGGGRGILYYCRGCTHLKGGEGVGGSLDWVFILYIPFFFFLLYLGIYT